MTKYTYSITAHDLPEKAVLQVIAALPKNTNISVALKETEFTRPKKPKQKLNGDTPLIMTGKSAQKGSNREKMMEVFERMEAKLGVGAVTRVQFRRKIADTKGLKPQVISQLINEGFLAPAGGAK